ncbi:MAG: class I adenylate cyclase [Pseudomonadota bacterium]
MTGDLSNNHTDLFAFQKEILSHRNGFVTYNVKRIREMIRYFSKRTLDLFYAVPFLLHVNSLRLPGYVADENVPCGIYRFHQTGLWEITKKFFRVTPREIRYILPKSYSIHALYLMGSLGTIGQTGYSDLDYWICVDNTAIEEKKFMLLKQKIRLIEKWGKENFEQDINFFVMDINKIKNNDFGRITEDSSGSAQKSLLKEEFYRTFILIAGKIPFWAVLPPRLTDKEHFKSIDMTNRIKNINFFVDDYIDLGNLSAICKEEFLGASLWQCFKASSDPIKAIIKTSLLAERFFADDQGLLLCDKIKQGFQQDHLGDSALDPYLLVFDHALHLYETLEDKAGLDLIRQCIFLRINGMVPLRSRLTEGPKKTLLEKFILEWKWDSEKINRMKSYAHWSEAEKLAFEDKILEKISFLFELLQNGLHNDQLPSFNMTPADLTALKNKIRACFQQGPGKIPRCSTYLKKIATESGYVISQQIEENNKSNWLLSRGSLSDQKSNRGILYSSHRLIPVLGWLIANRLCTDVSSVYFWSHQGAISQIQGQKLLKQLYDFFESGTAAQREASLSLQNIKMFIAINTEVSSSRDTLCHVDYLIQNTWQELFHHEMDLAPIENDHQKCYQIISDIQFFLPDYNNGKGAYKIYSRRKRLETEVAGSVEDLLKASSSNRLIADQIEEEPDVAPVQKSKKNILLDTF